MIEVVAGAQHYGEHLGWALAACGLPLAAGGAANGRVCRPPAEAGLNGVDLAIPGGCVRRGAQPRGCCHQVVWQPGLGSPNEGPCRGLVTAFKIMDAVFV